MAIFCLAALISLNALAKGLINASSKNCICDSPFLPLPTSIYSKPLKSSADGGTNNLDQNLSALAPRTLAAASENLASGSMPLFSDIISLNLLFKFLLNCILACCTSFFTSATFKTSCTASTFLYASSPKKKLL